MVQEGLIVVEWYAGSLPLFPGVEETHMSMARIRTEALEIIEIVLGILGGKHETFRNKVTY